MRVKAAGPRRIHRRKRILKLAEGFRGRRKNTIRRGKEAVERAMAYATRDRKQRKRDMRELWIIRINAAARANGRPYGKLIAGLKTANVEIDRKILADIAVGDEATFTKIAEGEKGAGRPAQ